MRGQPYTPCKLFYDGWTPVKAGEYIKTPAGSAYLIQAVHINRNKPYRQQLKCLRWPVEEIPKRAKVHPLHWYSRTKKKARRLSSFRASA
jgi:hypothetical protein